MLRILPIARSMPRLTGLAAIDSTADTVGAGGSVDDSRAAAVTADT
ncbi:MAG: hypothetical protein NTV94_11095 [Planctomycetota bacterium]|nr:hypothetical protein [Planctomycetota bacterium]